MNHYKCLTQQIFKYENLSLVPIRETDKFEILKIRNEQIYHLRQQKPLSEIDQNLYFKNVVDKLFHQLNPSQILFSVLEKGEFIGYGGLVHINWIDKNAEISFIMKTELEKEHFCDYWEKYLSILSDIAFKELKFHKLFTYAFDLRPKLYISLLNSGFHEEAKLKEHCFFDEKYIDVVIHSKINKLC